MDTQPRNTSSADAAKGDRAPSATTLAKALLRGTEMPRDPARAASLLNAAAQAGDGEAAAQIAVLIAAGARNAQDWNAALDYLQQSAEQGWMAGRQQLAVLSSDPTAVARAAADPEPEIWGVLRRAIALGAWFAPPAFVRVGTAPDIHMVENFLPQAACAWMIARARNLLARARTFDPATGTPRLDADRSNSAALFDIVESDLVLLAIRARICAATGFYAHQLEETNVLHYATGERFAAHYDFLSPDASGVADEIARKGQRVATFLIYLNDDFEGAETDFPLLGRKFRPARGGALRFSNIDASGIPDRKTLHAGLPPVSGEKWLLSQWIRAVP